MCVIDNETGIIRICRGDDVCIPLFIDCGTDWYSSRYILSENDEVIFCLMEPNHTFECGVLRKEYNSQSEKSENGDLLIKLSSEDTENLFGYKYYYMIKLISFDEHGNQEITTLVPCREFYIEG